MSQDFNVPIILSMAQKLNGTSSDIDANECDVLGIKIDCSEYSLESFYH